MFIVIFTFIYRMKIASTTTTTTILNSSLKKWSRVNNYEYELKIEYMYILRDKSAHLQNLVLKLFLLSKTRIFKESYCIINRIKHLKNIYEPNFEEFINIMSKLVWEKL